MRFLSRCQQCHNQVLGLQLEWVSEQGHTTQRQSFKTLNYGKKTVVNDQLRDCLIPVVGITFGVDTSASFSQGHHGMPAGNEE